MEKSHGFPTSACALISVTKLLPGVDTQVHPWCISFRGCLLSLTAQGLTGHHWYPSMPTWETSLGALAHTAECPSDLPEVSAHKSSTKQLFPPSYTLWTGLSWKERAKTKISTIFPLCYQGKKNEFSESKRRSLEALCSDLGQEFLQPQEKHAVFWYR